MQAGGRSLVISGGGRLAERVAAAGGELVDFPAATKNPARMLANAYRLDRLIRAERIDLLHVRSRAPAWSALLAARRTAVPMVATYHGAYGERGRIKNLYNSVMARGDLVIANSRYTADLVRLRHGTPEARIRVVHRGVDPTVFNPAAVTAERVSAMRRRWQVGPDDKVVLHMARLTGWKGQRVVIEAAARLVSSSHADSAVFVFAGDAQGRDAYQRELEQQAAARGIVTNVRFPGHIDDVPAAFAAAHVAVVASTEPEAFGRAAIEAQSMGCPVIATDIGAPPETILAQPRVSAAEITGWLVAPGDAATLADRIGSVLSATPAQRAVIRERARVHVVTHFTLARMQHATLRVYDDLLATRLADRIVDMDSGQRVLDGA